MSVRMLKKAKMMPCVVVKVTDGHEWCHDCPAVSEEVLRGSRTVGDDQGAFPERRDQRVPPLLVFHMGT